MLYFVFWIVYLVFGTVYLIFSSFGTVVLVFLMVYRVYRMHCNGVHDKHQQLPSQSTIEGAKYVMWTPPGEEVQAPRRETKIWTVTAWGALRLVATVNSGRAPA